MRKNPQVVAKVLRNIYRQKFGGKEKGRFILKREDLRRLAGRTKLEQSIIDAIAYECFEKGYYLIDMEENFGVIRVDVITGWRKVPSRIIDEVMPSEI